jgi:hypothetical protein
MFVVFVMARPATLMLLAIAGRRRCRRVLLLQWEPHGVQAWEICGRRLFAPSNASRAAASAILLSAVIPSLTRRE